MNSIDQKFEAFTLQELIDVLEIAKNKLGGDVSVICFEQYEKTGAFFQIKKMHGTFGEQTVGQNVDGTPVVTLAMIKVSPETQKQWCHHTICQQAFLANNKYDKLCPKCMKDRKPQITGKLKLINDQTLQEAEEYKKQNDGHGCSYIEFNETSADKMMEFILSGECTPDYLAGQTHSQEQYNQAIELYEKAAKMKPLEAAIFINEQTGGNEYSGYCRGLHRHENGKLMKKVSCCA